MLARPSGPQIDENRCEITSTGVCARCRTSTGTAPDAVSGAPCSVARAGADAAPASSPRRLIMRPVSPCITRPSVTSWTVFNLSRMVFSYCGRLAAIATTCDTIIDASPPTRTVVMITAPSTAVTCERTSRRSLRTSGASSRLRSTASVIGTSTSRPKYSSPSTTAPLTRPPTWNWVGWAGGAGVWTVTGRLSERVGKSAELSAESLSADFPGTALSSPCTGCPPRRRASPDRWSNRRRSPGGLRSAGCSRPGRSRAR